jgi:putative MFS transporter
MQTNSPLQKFDQASLGRFHVLLLTLTGSCWAWAAYGVTIVGFMLPALKAEWEISASELGYLAGIGMLGMLAGSVIGGVLSDRIGRKKTLVLVMIYLGFAFVASSFSRSYTILLAFRFLTGMGLGAILPAGGTLVAEFSPIRYRGILVVLMNGFWGLGGTIASLVGFSLVLKYGWRPAMLVGGLAAVSGVLILWLLPESIRFLIGKGRYAQADVESARVDVGTGIVGGVQTEFKPVVVADTKTKSSIWSSQFARITGSLWVMWFSLNFLYQGVFIWLPTLLANTGSYNRSYMLTLIISLGQIPGTILVAALADRVSRRKLIIFSLGLLGAAAILFGFGESTIWVLVVGFMLMVFNGMAWGLAHPFSSELYPTRMRGTATGWATGIGRLGGVVAPILIASVIQAGGGTVVSFSILALAPILSMVVLSWIKLETTGKSLEEIHKN